MHLSQLLVALPSLLSVTAALQPLGLTAKDGEVFQVSAGIKEAPVASAKKRSTEVEARQATPADPSDSSTVEIDYLGANVSDRYVWPPPSQKVPIPNTPYSIEYSRIAINDSDGGMELWSTPVNTTRLESVLKFSVDWAKKQQQTYANVSGVMYDLRAGQPGIPRKDYPGQDMEVHVESYRVNSYDSARYNFSLAWSYRGNATWALFGNVSQFLLDQTRNSTVQDNMWTLGFAGRISGIDGIYGRADGKPFADVLVNACYWENCTCVQGIC
ncbi:MAG: hypothetical protein M1817_000418 [Caeruleum heppii]|nr:MAG: hypothetical protein M1817_000418 [Caeruleum heppii]